MMNKAQHTELKVGNTSPTNNRGELICCGRENSRRSTSGK